MTVAGGIDMYEQTRSVPVDIPIEDYASLVKRIAHHMIARMPASVQVDDLIQAGMIGLIEASKKYDASKGASFETYAGIRIRGSIVDEVRKGDWVPRSVHRNARRISETVADVEATLGRDAKDSEIAEAMGIDLVEYHSMSSDALSGRLFSIEDTFAEDGTRDISDEHHSVFTAPHDDVQKSALTSALGEAILNLPERERLVMALYYDEELNLKEIGKILGVSESRVSQIHSQAALRLRSRLKDW